SSYSVEKLDQLMIRMIAEKLSGQSGLPQDVIAVEEPEQAAGISPAVNSPPPPQNVIQVQQPTASTTAPPPVSMPSLPPATNPLSDPSPASQSNVVAGIFAALIHFDWWG